MDIQIRKLERKNEILQKKLKKYENSSFGYMFIISIILFYLSSIFLNVNRIEYARIFDCFSNTTTMVMIGGIITGSMLLTCKLEYIKSSKKIRKLINSNNKKINILKQKNLVQEKKNINVKKINSNKTDDKKIKQELENIKSELINEVNKMNLDVIQEKKKKADNFKKLDEYEETIINAKNYTKTMDIQKKILEHMEYERLLDEIEEVEIISIDDIKKKVLTRRENNK